MDESPTRQLADEHEYVMLVVGAMDAEAASIERTGRVHADRVVQMVDFTRNFTDGDHHAKEEDLLFPLLEERSAAAGGTISVLLSEHEAARATIAENLRLYAFLLPLHIGKEDTVLFPLMEDALSVRELEMLGEDFAKLARGPGSADAAARYHRLAHTLAEPPAD